MPVHRAVALLAAAWLTGCAAPTEQTPAELWLSSCAGCHGNTAQGTIRGPDLRLGAQGLDVDDVVDVILDGEGLMAAVDVHADEAEDIARFLLEDLLLR